MKHLNMRGETIIEVLIAMTVAATVLSSAFVVVNHSTGAARGSQEHSEALQIARSQLERAKTLIDSTQASGIYCVSPDGILKGPMTADPKKLPATFADYDPACSGANVSDGFQGYAAAVMYDQAAGTYRVSVVWDSLTGGKNSVGLSYNVFGGSPTGGSSTPIIYRSALINWSTKYGCGVSNNSNCAGQVVTYYQQSDPANTKSVSLISNQPSFVVLTGLDASKTYAYNVVATKIIPSGAVTRTEVANGIIGAIQ